MDLLLWLDLETTGLDPDNDHVLQVAYGITDTELRGITPVVDRLIRPTADTWALIQSSQFIQDMHGRTGLLDRLTDDSQPKVLIEDAEDDILRSLNSVQEATGAGMVTLAGASVHFDKGFLNNWMPRLNDKISHRIFDTTTLQVFFRNVGYEHGVQNVNQHDAIHDVLYCIEVAREYRYEVTRRLQSGARAEGEAL